MQQQYKLVLSDTIDSLIITIDIGYCDDDYNDNRYRDCDHVLLRMRIFVNM